MQKDFENTIEMSSRNGLRVFVAVLVFLILCLICLSVFLLTKTKNQIDNTVSCDYYANTYVLNESFKSKDDCNTCTCTINGIICTKKACLIKSP